MAEKPMPSAATPDDPGKRYRDAMLAPRELTPQDQETVATLLNEAVEMVMRKHLPVKMGEDVICICDARLIFEGPVGQRLHVAEKLREAGLLRG